MRLPRWALWSAIAICVLAPLAVVANWWITWPVETAREFAEQVAAGKPSLLSELMPEWPTDRGPSFEDCFRAVNDDNRSVKIMPRRWSDITSGGVRFQIGNVWVPFVAERGVVRTSDRQKLHVAVLLHRTVIQESRRMQTYENERHKLESESPSDPMLTALDQKVEEIRQRIVILRGRIEATRKTDESLQ